MSSLYSLFSKFRLNNTGEDSVYNLFNWNLARNIFNFKCLSNLVFKKEENPAVSGLLKSVLSSNNEKDTSLHDKSCYDVVISIVAAAKNMVNPFIFIIDIENSFNIFKKAIAEFPKENLIIVSVSSNPSCNTYIRQIENGNNYFYATPVRSSQSADIGIIILTTLLNLYLPERVPIVLISADNFITNLAAQLTMVQPIRSTKPAQQLSWRKIFPLKTNDREYDENIYVNILWSIITGDSRYVAECLYSEYTFRGFYDIPDDKEIYESTEVDTYIEAEPEVKNTGIGPEANEYFRKLYLKHWRGTYASFTYEYRLNTSNFSRWVRGLRSSLIMPKAVMKFCQKNNIEVEERYVELLK